eukprot:Gb_27944 [translate_table: standard]
MEKIGNDEGFEFDPKYEFSAPHFFDFIEGETQEKAKEAELWFKTALTYTASPYVAKIKSRQRFAVETLCSFEEAGQLLDRVSPEKPKEEPTVASSLDKLFPTGSSRNCDDNKDGERTGMPQANPENVLSSSIYMPIFLLIFNVVLPMWLAEFYELMFMGLILNKLPACFHLIVTCQQSIHALSSSSLFYTFSSVEVSGMWHKPDILILSSFAVCLDPFFVVPISFLNSIFFHC